MYTLAQIQAIAVRAACCASSLGYTSLSRKRKGKDCTDDELNIKYLVRARKSLLCYKPVGSVINSGVGATAVLNIPDNGAGAGQARIVIGSTVIFNSLNTFGTLKLMLDNLVGLGVAGWTISYRIVAPFNFILTIVSPAGDYNGQTLTFSYFDNSVKQTRLSYSLSMQGGQYTQTAEMSCITDEQADQLVQNITSICGCLCDGCYDYYSDITDPAVNNTVITIFNPAGQVELRFRFNTNALQGSYDMSAIAGQYNWNNIVIDALDFGNAPLTSNQYTLTGTILNFNFDPALIGAGTEVNIEMHSI